MRRAWQPDEPGVVARELLGRQAGGRADPHVLQHAVGDECREQKQLAGAGVA